MSKEPKPEEVATIRAAAVLVVATLAYPRLVPVRIDKINLSQYVTVGDYAEASECRKEALARVASEAFDAGEAFVIEAERRGLDPVAIMKAAALAGF